jgi:nitroreductase
MNNFEILQRIILNRRSNKPVQMNGKKIDDSLVQQLLELADWAPTHGHTEPWRFIVYSDEAVKGFCKEHAELYKSITPAEKFNTATFEKLSQMGDKASHVIISYCKRGDNPKIPVLEEIAATSASIENILLGAEALDIAVLWSTGGLVHNPALKQYFNLREEDTMMAVLYLGYVDEATKEGKRIVPLENKIVWNR